MKRSALLCSALLRSALLCSASRKKEVHYFFVDFRVTTGCGDFPEDANCVLSLVYSELPPPSPPEDANCVHIKLTVSKRRKGNAVLFPAWGLLG